MERAGAWAEGGRGPGSASGRDPQTTSRTCAWWNLEGWKNWDVTGPFGCWFREGVALDDALLARGNLTFDLLLKF